MRAGSEPKGYQFLLRLLQHSTTGSHQHNTPTIVGNVELLAKIVDTEHSCRISTKAVSHSQSNKERNNDTKSEKYGDNRRPEPSTPFNLMGEYHG
jgi:hypothetical protein